MMIRANVKSAAFGASVALALGGVAAFTATVLRAAEPAATGPAAAPAVAGPATRRPWPRRQIIQGEVRDAAGAKVKDALVLVFEADTGEPYSSVTDYPIRDRQWNGELPPVARAVSDGDGHFHVRGLFPGNYRLLALSWDGVTPATAKDGNDIDTSGMTLHGIVERVVVVEERAPNPVVIRPVGTATVHLRVPSWVALLVSTRPLTGDMLLGPVAIKGDFLRHLVGAVAYTHGEEVTLRGLPAGPLYFFAMGEEGARPARDLAYGAVQVIGEADTTVHAAVDLVSPRDGERPLPAALAAIVAARKPGGGGGGTLEKALRAAVESTDPPADAWEGPGREFYAAWSLPLDQEVFLSTGGRATIRDLLTIHTYDQFNHLARVRQEEAKARAAKPD